MTKVGKKPIRKYLVILFQNLTFLKSIRASLSSVTQDGTSNFQPSLKPTRQYEIYELPSGLKNIPLGLPSINHASLWCKYWYSINRSVTLEEIHQRSKPNINSATTIFYSMALTPPATASGASPAHGPLWAMLAGLVYAQHGHELMRWKSSIERSPSLAINIVIRC